LPTNLSGSGRVAPLGLQSIVQLLFAESIISEPDQLHAREPAAGSEC
jgi:hypothetical protein